MVSRNKTYKTCKKNKVDEFIDNLMNWIGGNYVILGQCNEFESLC
jgi:hypothetical protein